MTPPGTVEGHERLRLFCALRLPDDILDRLEPWQHEHLSGGRLVRREQLHLTLAFLGSRPRGDLPAIVGALRDAARPASEIRFSTVRYRETRSVGMLVLDDETAQAGALALRLFDGLESAGVYEREQRRWLPHVTVLRFRERPRLDPPLPELRTFRPSDAAVYISVLRPSGAQYDVLETVALGG